MKIDLIYLWVDGNDEKWAAKKEAFIKEKGYQLGEANHKARFIENDELKYSLRSIYRFAPWINHIFIVTDNQIPSWLNTEDSRITIVDHKEILPAEALPTYSSPAIEWCLDKIPGLSEHFMLANDDVFIAKPVTPNFFYNELGYPIIRQKRRVKSHKVHSITMYMHTILETQKIVGKKFGKKFNKVPHHNIDSYCLTDFIACKQTFQPLVDKTIYRHFRSKEDLQRVAVHYYNLAIGHGDFKKMGRYNRKMPFWKKIKDALHNHYHYDSRYIGITAASYERIMTKYDPILFCLNDNEGANDDCRIRARKFLENMFPEKSPFEKE